MNDTSVYGEVIAFKGSKEINSALRRCDEMNKNSS